MVPIIEQGRPAHEAGRTWRYYTEPLRVDVRGLPTAYRRVGSGEPVVYLHGHTLTRRWLPLFARLSEDVDLLVPEHPGFGDTPLPDWLGGFDDLVIHYDELFDLLGLGRVHLVGHSIGGWLAAEYAVFYPRRVKSLTLVAPLGLRVPGHPVRDLFRMTPAEFGPMLFNETADSCMEHLSDGDEVETLVQRYAELTALGRLMWNPRYDVKLDRRLGRINCPVLLVAPADDRVVPPEHLARWLELLPNATLMTVNGGDTPTGHLLVIQEPGKLAGLIVAFVATACDRD
jgi:pimeloyl-ACP methyl ester carboxylesterase